MLVGNLPYANGRSDVVLRLTNAPANSTNGYAPRQPDPKPTTSNDYMNFNGTSQIIRYSDRTDWHVTAPYSVELEVYMVDNQNRWIATVGEGFGIGWPEWSIFQNGAGDLAFASSDNNNEDTSTAVFMNHYNVNQWYKIGLMIYTSGSDIRVRGYVNDTQTFDQVMTQPIDSINDLAIGGDAAAYASRLFKGRIRNVTIGHSEFWPI